MSQAFPTANIKEWASAAYHLFATGMMMPLDAGIEVRDFRLNLPDAGLDGLCDASMDDNGRPAV